MNSKIKIFNNKSVWEGNDSPAESIYCQPDKTQPLLLPWHPEESPSSTPGKWADRIIAES